MTCSMNKKAIQNVITKILVFYGTANISKSNIRLDKNNKIVIEFCSFEEQVADVFAQSWEADMFLEFKNKHVACQNFES